MTLVGSPAHAPSCAERLRGHQQRGGRRRNVEAALIIRPRIVQGGRVEQIKQQAWREIQQSVSPCVVPFDRIVCCRSQCGDSRAPVPGDSIVPDQVTGVSREVVQEDSPMIARDFVVGDLVSCVLGPREQVDPSTKQSRRRLYAIVPNAVVSNRVVAAATEQHHAVVAVVP